MLFFTGFSRTASNIAKGQLERLGENKAILRRFYEMVDEAKAILESKNDLYQIGKLLNESWNLKRRLSEQVSTDYIDYLYDSAISAGAIGGKLLGAGGGGFLLLFVEPDAQESVKRKLYSLLHVPFKFEYSGSQVIFNGDVKRRGK